MPGPHRPTLYLTIAPHPDASDRLCLHLADLDGEALEAHCRRPSPLTPNEEQDLRWYLEDYPRWSTEAALRTGRRIEASLEEAGARIFAELFGESAETQRIWVKLRKQLDVSSIDIELDTASLRIHWDLMRESQGARPLSMSVARFGFKRSPLQVTGGEPASVSESIRLLLVISRPALGHDIPFRSVATHIVKDLAGHPFEISVLRPSTYEQLSETLWEAHRSGNPFDIVHFDGHGAYVDLGEISPGGSSKYARDGEDLIDEVAESLRTVYSDPIRPGRRGYLYFENPSTFHNIRLVDGAKLGWLLTETGVRLLVLNACRSADVQPASSPGSNGIAFEGENDRTLGSVAREVLDAGGQTVVAMRYNLLVDTAARFVSALYTSIAKYLTVGMAVMDARRQLYDHPIRRIGASERPLGDWLVPSLFGLGDIHFNVPDRSKPSSLGIALWNSTLPPPPDTGFFGMDQVILEIEQTFYYRGAVVLYGIAGSGKTTAAAEFARWSYRTSGIGTTTIFTSFERKTTLPMLLDQFAYSCQHLLGVPPTDWSMLQHDVKRRIVINLLARTGILWIWDNIESIGGFPIPMQSPWTIEEQEELNAFLTDAATTRARFVLTSRRTADPLFDAVSHRIAIGGLSRQDRAALALSIASEVPPAITDAWGPLLDFTQGNPVAVKAVVHGVLKEQLSAPTDVMAYLQRLQDGVSNVDVDVRAHSIVVASIQYSLENAFSIDDRRVLAMLCKVHGFVNAMLIEVMAAIKDSPLVERGGSWNREDIVSVFERAREIGLLTKVVDGAFLIHPILPQIIRAQFQSFYGDIEPAIEKVLCGAMAGEGTYLVRLHHEGQMGAVRALAFEEPNLLFGLDVAIQNLWLEDICGLMQGLEVMYRFHGRHGDWKRIVSKVTPIFMMESGQPMHGREDGWALISSYISNIAREELRWKDAEKLIAQRLKLNKSKAEPLLERKGKLTESQRVDVHNYANSLHDLAEIRRLQRDMACFDDYRASLDLHLLLGAKSVAAGVASNLGHAYQELADDLEGAEASYDMALSLAPAHDTRMRAVCLGALGNVALLRYAREPPLKAYHRFVERARNLSEESLQLMSADGVSDLAVIHNQLGRIYAHLGVYDKSLEYYRKAIEYADLEGHLLHRLFVRLNIVGTFALGGQYDHAREFALEVLSLSEGMNGPRIQGIRVQARELLEVLGSDPK